MFMRWTFVNKKMSCEFDEISELGVKVCVPPTLNGNKLPVTINYGFELLIYLYCNFFYDLYE